MSIHNATQLETSRGKLALLEERMIALKAEPIVNTRTRELSRHSLQKLINELKEEIARFHTRAPARS